MNPFIVYAFVFLSLLGSVSAQGPPFNPFAGLEQEIANAPKALDPAESEELETEPSRSQGRDLSKFELWDSKNPVQELEPLPRWPSPWVFSYQIEVGSEQSYVDSNDSVTLSSESDEYRLVPHEVNRRKQEFIFRWNPTQNDEVQLLVPLIFSKAKLVEQGGAEGTLDEVGVGDVALDYVRYAYGDRQEVYYMSLGARIPTGRSNHSIKLDDGSTELLPYALQMGRGHYEARLGAGYRRPLDRKTDAGIRWWGSLPVDDNDKGFRYGASTGVRFTYEYDLFDWFTVRPRITGRWSDSIQGRDLDLDPSDSPVHDPSNYGGTSFDVGLVSIYYFPGDPYKTRYVLLGLDYTVWRDTPGIQLSEDWVFQFGLGWRF